MSVQGNLAAALVRESAARNGAVTSLHRAMAILQDAEGRGLSAEDTEAVSEAVHNAARHLTGVTG